MQCYFAVHRRFDAVMMMSGRRPGLPVMAWVFSERTWPRGIISWRRLPRALLELGYVWRGMGYRIPGVGVKSGLVWRVLD